MWNFPFILLCLLAIAAEPIVYQSGGNGVADAKLVLHPDGTFEYTFQFLEEKKPTTLKGKYRQASHTYDLFFENADKKIPKRLVGKKNTTAHIISTTNAIRFNQEGPVLLMGLFLSLIPR